jgi:hypothetical protein
MFPPTCSDCGAEKEMVEVVTGAEQYKCPNCYTMWYEKGDRPAVRCRGCWEVKTCILHHVSYVPEKTVPMCHDCHDRLHDDDSAYLSHLEPDMSRREAEAINPMLKTGIDEWIEEQRAGD